MNWPNIVFSEKEKQKFQEMAVTLELKLATDSKNFKDLERFSEYPPLVEAIRLAKEKKIDTPFVVPNTNYWFFETEISDWMRWEGTGILSKFLLAIEGFPYEEIKDDDLPNDA